MREDLKEALVECYRFAPEHMEKKKYRNHRRSKYFHDLETIKTKEGMKSPYGWDAKAFGENLAPLRGIIVKNVGQYWPKIYSELCRLCDRRSATGQHIFDHLKDFIHINTFLDQDGNICVKLDYNSIYRPIMVRVEHQEQFLHKCGNVYYVHPISQQIMRKKYIPEKSINNLKKPVISGTFQFHWIGHWEVVVVKKFPGYVLLGTDRPNKNLTKAIIDNTNDMLSLIHKHGNRGFKFEENTYVIDRYPACKSDIKWYGLE